jgi:hypothetical protein
VLVGDLTVRAVPVPARYTRRERDTVVCSFYACAYRDAALDWEARSIQVSSSARELSQTSRCGDIG